MAYSDIQNKVGQTQMANQILLAERKIPPPEEGEGTRDYRKRISGGTYKNKNKKNKTPSDADIQTEGNMKGQVPPEDIFGEDYQGGPTYLRQLLQIGGAIGGGVVPLLQQLLIRNPNAMAMDFKDAMGGGGFVGTQRTNVFINQGGEAYIREPDGNMKFDGMYTPEIHGPIFPGMGLVQNQSNNNMKIAKLPHSPPVEKIVLPNGKLMDSPLRFKTDQERIKFMEDFSRGYGRYS